MKCQIYRDEMYPCYYCDHMDGTFPPWGEKVIDWPIELDYKLFKASLEEFHYWQDQLEILFNRAEPVGKETAWSIINSPSATTTSSTPTF